jgi:hypothetical protein
MDLPCSKTATSVHSPLNICFSLIPYELFDPDVVEIPSIRGITLTLRA